MKTSFYFFLWFIVYYLIGLTGIPLLIQNGSIRILQHKPLPSLK